jgi:glucokinase
MTDYSRKALVGDIGGTNIRFAISDFDELTIDHFASLRTADFASPQEALKQYLRTIPSCPDRVGLAVAGPVLGGAATMSHVPWSFTKDDIRAVTGAQEVQLINNFEAVALMVPHLTDFDLVTIGKTRPAVPMATKVVIGVGTGLGVAALFTSPSGSFTTAGEGGHASLGASNETELVRMLAVTAGHDYPAAEHLLSGAGLSALYQTIAKETGIAVRPLDAPEVIKAAASGEDAVAESSLTQFAAWLGRFAGDVALLYGARGGVFLAGGIPSAIINTLNADAFETAFRARGRLTPYAASIPIHVIKAASDAGLRGAALTFDTRPSPQ